MERLPDWRISSAVMMVMLTGVSDARCGVPEALVVTGSPKISCRAP